MSNIAVPGMRLSTTQSDASRLIGCYRNDKYTFASVAGSQLSVESGVHHHYKQTSSTSHHMPQVDSVVIGRITKITPAGAYMDIHAIDSHPVRDTFSGVIRHADVRSFDKDRVLVHESFRPGDLVRAVVISLGDTQCYYLSTARDDLGVVFSISRHAPDTVMIPIAWDSIQCPVTGIVEHRKCAKPNNLIK